MVISPKMTVQSHSLWHTGLEYEAAGDNESLKHSKGVRDRACNACCQKRKMRFRPLLAGVSVHNAQCLDEAACRGRQCVLDGVGCLYLLAEHCPSTNTILPAGHEPPRYRTKSKAMLVVHHQRRSPHGYRQKGVIRQIALSSKLRHRSLAGGPANSVGTKTQLSPNSSVASI